MARKPDIQYVGQFYSHGSAARQLEQNTEPVKQPKEQRIPLHRFQQIEKLYVDPLAIVSLVVAMALLIAMVSGAMMLKRSWNEMETAARYLSQVEQIHTKRLVEYHSGYNLKEVREAALNMGLVPVSEVPVMNIAVTVPEPEIEPTVWENFVWFMEGLFA